MHTGRLIDNIKRFLTSYRACLALPLPAGRRQAGEVRDLYLGITPFYNENVRTIIERHQVLYNLDKIQINHF